jgi:hypothetical protein
MWHRIAALRQPARAVRLASILWIVWAVVVWNVIFDQVIVSAGRHYIVAAELAVKGAASIPPHFEDMDQWMRPAVTRALWTASASAAAIVAIGFSIIHVTKHRLNPTDAGFEAKLR